MATLRFYLDQHVHKGIAEGLRRRGIDVLTAVEDGHQRALDEALLQRNTSLSRVLVSQDKDFLRIANEMKSDGQTFRGVVFMPHNVSIGSAVNQLERMSRRAIEGDMSSKVVFLKS